MAYAHIFYGDYRCSKNPQNFLYDFEEHLTSLPDLTESRKCEHFYLNCRLGFNAEEWYENFEQNSLSVIALWSTLRKHFCVKWLGASSDSLLKIPEGKPVTMTQLGAATITSHEMNTTTTIPTPNITTTNAIYKTATPERLNPVVDAHHIIAPPMPIPNQLELKTATSTTTAMDSNNTMAIEQQDNKEATVGGEKEQEMGVEKQDRTSERKTDAGEWERTAMTQNKPARFDWAVEVDKAFYLSPVMPDTMQLASTNPALVPPSDPIPSDITINPIHIESADAAPIPVRHNTIAQADHVDLPLSVNQPTHITTDNPTPIMLDNPNPSVHVDPVPAAFTKCSPIIPISSICVNPDLIVPICITPPAPVHIDPVKDTREHSCALHLWFCGRSEDSWWRFRRFEKRFWGMFHSRF
jgi:hypothetical protein